MHFGAAHPRIRFDTFSADFHTSVVPTPRRRSVRRRLISPVSLFTGIVQGKAEVASVDRKGKFSSIKVQFPEGKLSGVQVGASVAINGTCLTVTEFSEDLGNFDIIEETLRATNLGRLDQGSSVNFERSARVGDEIGGHDVSGHVHFTAQVESVEETENNRKVTFKIPSSWQKYVLPKGFIAVDGISLTVGEVGPDWFCVYLIPETLRATIMGSRKEGDLVNIEIDARTQAIVDTVEKVMEDYVKGKKLPSALQNSIIAQEVS